MDGGVTPVQYVAGASSREGATVGQAAVAASVLLVLGGLNFKICAAFPHLC